MLCGAIYRHVSGPSDEADTSNLKTVLIHAALRGLSNFVFGIWGFIGRV